MKEPVVQFKDLYKNIGKKKIIKGLSFDVYPGEVFGFLGPNGAGKTTTIRMLFGLMSMTKGDILIDGKSVKKDFEGAVAHVGGIVENPEMYQFMSGYKNLRQYGRMHGNISKERIDEVVKQVGLTNRINDKVKTYSLGMRQRLGLAQALLHNPKVIVLDEPTNGLDPAGIKEFRTHLRMLAAEENVAVIVSSHILSEMELMCDRFGIIQHGKLVGIQTVSAIQEAADGDVIDEKLIIHVDDPLKAIGILTEILHQSKGSSLQPVQNGKLVEVLIPFIQIPEVIRTLANGGVDIYEVRKEKKTLEDTFIEMTGGNEIA